MKYNWINDHFLQKKGVAKDFKAEWNAIRYLILDKMICMITNNKEGEAIITLKCEPAFAEALREDYKEITAGYYMNKMHWNSILLDGDVPDDIMKMMIDMSYDLILNGFSKKKQKEILESENV